MQMTDKDWQKVLQTHSDSLDAMTGAKGTKNHVPQPKSTNQLPPLPGTSKSDKSSKDAQEFKYIRIEKTTPKAKFFVTYEDLAEVHGFWCPNAAIIKHTGGSDNLTVHVAHWCNISIINFN